MDCKHEWDKTGERCIKCGSKDWMENVSLPNMRDHGNDGI